MQLQRALELCQQPLNASRSHIVKVDRFALTHLLDQAAKDATTAGKVPGLESRINDLKTTLAEKEDEIKALQDDTAKK